MHILNLRFKNLNSLAGEWFIDFQRPEYQDEGSFLITGPTGAGKTTILDAICLALYGRTPRVEISDKQNELMTRQTNDCYAEVAFVCKDGLYRARCEHRRTRPGSRSPFQTPKRELVNEDGSIVTANNKDVTPAVEERTGLKYTQFVRAILLAQGDFDALLKSSEDDKARILENLTNTSIYRELARMAHDRNNRENDALEKLRQQMRELALPDEKEENTLKQELDNRRKLALELDVALENCTTNINWRNQVDDLKKEAMQLGQYRQKLDEEQARFAPRLAELEKAQKAAPLEDKYARREELHEYLRKQQQECERNAATLQSLKEQARTCEESIAQAKYSLAQWEQEEKEAVPQLAKARELDASMAAEFRELQRLLAENNRLEKQAKDVEQQLRKKKEEKQNHAKYLEECESWLKEHPQGEWLVENLNALKLRILEFERLQKETDDARRKWKRDKKQALDMQAHLDDLEKQRKAATQRMQDAEHFLNDLQAQKFVLLGGKSEDTWRVERMDLQRQHLESVNLKKLQDFRYLLKNGEPCPLCGSIEHPLNHANVPDEDALLRRCREIDELLKEADKIENSCQASEKALMKRHHEYGELNVKAETMLEQRAGWECALAESRENLQKLESASAVLEKELIPQFESFGIKMGDSNAQDILECRLANWRKVQQQRDEYNKFLQNTEVEVSRLSNEFNQATLAVQTGTQQLNARKKEIAAIQKKRHAIFDGRQADVEENRLRHGLEKARKELAAQIDVQAKNSANMAGAEKEKELLAESLQKLTTDELKAAQIFAEALVAVNMNENDFRTSRRTQEQIQEIEKTRNQLEVKQNQLAGQIAANARKLDSELAKALTIKESEALLTERKEIRLKQAQMQKEILAKELLLKSIEEKRDEAERLEKLIAGQTRECARWQSLKSVIGAANGKDFQSFAQSITMDILLRHANRHLARITDRYEFRRQSGQRTNLDIAVIDNYQAGEIRTISNLSGGETFIASLALALGLSSMAGRNAVMGSLFLDEGFGTLDPKTLYDALDAISSLRMDGKLIGIISHVEALKEKIATHIQIRPTVRGRSEISGPGCSRL